MPTGGNARSGIGHGKPQQTLRGQAFVRQHDTPGAREFGSVAEQMQQHLLDTLEVGAHHGIGDRQFVQQAHAGMQFRQGALHAVVAEVVQRRDVAARQVARLVEVGDFEHVVEKPQQGRTVGFDDGGILARGRLVAEFGRQHLRKSDDRIEGRAHLVRHMLDKFGLHAAGLLGLLLGFEKLLAADPQMLVLGQHRRFGGLETPVELHHARISHAARHQHSRQQADNQIGVAQAFALEVVLQLLGFVVQAADFENSRKIVRRSADFAVAHRVRQTDVFPVIGRGPLHLTQVPVDVAKLLGQRIVVEPGTADHRVALRLQNRLQRLPVLARSLEIGRSQIAQPGRMEPQ